MRMEGPDFSKIFHAFSKRGHPDDRKGSFSGRADALNLSGRREYKIYSGVPTVSLPDQSDRNHPIFSAFLLRKSEREYSAINSLNLQDLAQLLKYSVGSIDDGKLPITRRPYPSAGALYPLEIYLLVFRQFDGLKTGIYHYRVDTHELECIEERVFLDEDIGDIASYEWVKKGSVMIVLTAVFERTQSKYNERGYRYVLIEAGHVGQNMCLAAPALSLKICPLVGTYDSRIEQLLEIDGITESVVYSLVIGK